GWSQTALPPVVQEANMEPLLLCIVLSWLLVLGPLFSDDIESAAASVGQTGAEGAGAVEDDRLLQRLRSHKLLMTYLFWKAARNGDRPPRLSDIRWQGHLDSPYVFLAAVEYPEQAAPRFRYLRIGCKLEQRAGHSLAGLRTSEVNAQANEDYVGSLEGAYRRCVRTLRPTYEYARYNFSDGSPMTFERLILPLAGTNGRIAHLIGVVLFSKPESCSDGTMRS
ncbi:MAG: hypothetical protein ACJ8AW_23085, partial [Rhodopila sp.]